MRRQTRGGKMQLPIIIYQNDGQQRVTYLTDVGRRSFQCLVHLRPASARAHIHRPPIGHLFSIMDFELCPTIILRPREETAALAGPRAAIRGYSVSPDNHHIQDDCYLTPYIEYLKAARFSPSLRYLFSELGIHLIPQAIAEKVEGQNGDHYGKAGKDHYEGCFSHEQTAVVEH
jgi:hypothetical protein